MNYEIIASGSDGNCTIVDNIIAIDMGVPYRSIERRVKDLKLVLLSHVHGDHFRKSTVKRLARQRPTLKWVCRDWMVEPLREQGVDPRNIHALPADQWQYYATPISVMVCPFDTTHDALNCGWLLWRGEHDNLFYATDLATLDGIEAKAYTTYLLEANYREAELEQRMAEKLDAGGFAYETRAAETHLSFEQATAWLQENMAPWSVWVPMHEHKERGKEDGKSEGNTEGNQV